LSDLRPRLNPSQSNADVQSNTVQSLREEAITVFGTVQNDTCPACTVLQFTPGNRVTVQ